MKTLLTAFTYSLALMAGLLTGATLAILALRYLLT